MLFRYADDCRRYLRFTSDEPLRQVFEDGAEKPARLPDAKAVRRLVSMAKRQIHY